MKDDTVKAVVAMGCITIMEIAAILAGIDGALLTIATSLIAGIAGYEVKAIRDRRSQE